MPVPPPLSLWAQIAVGNGEPSDMGSQIFAITPNQVALGGELRYPICLLFEDHHEFCARLLRTSAKTDFLQLRAAS